MRSGRFAQKAFIYLYMGLIVFSVHIYKLSLSSFRSRALRRCGRHIHWVCDANDDNAVYPKEWRNCLLPNSELNIIITITTWCD